MNEKTLADLKAAFAGESQANRKYLAFAKKADEEGFADVAKLFRVAAEGETRHAMRHLTAMNGVGTTAENLKAALDGETYEFTDMYPGFIKTAEAANEAVALDAFEDADTVEKEHGKLYSEALGNPAEFKLGRVWVCQNCGHVHIGDTAEDKCDVCGFPGSQFKEVE
jgi:rubrerythrin